jgi:hypothetical protein
MMAEWGIPFHVMETQWTCSQLEAMWARLVERKKQENDAMKKAKGAAHGNTSR